MKSTGLFAGAASAATATGVARVAGCKAVTGDKTKVKCTAAKNIKLVQVTLVIYGGVTGRRLRATPATCRRRARMWCTTARPWWTPHRHDLPMSC